MRICDAHCDTMKKMSQGMPYDFSFEDAASNDGFLQIFACFSEEDENSPHQALYALQSFKENTEAEIIYTAKHALAVLKKGGFGAMLSLENCCCLGEDIENLYHFYNLGIRSITLTWNGENQFAHGSDCPAGGLTHKGRDLILLAEKLGVLIDLSHLNRQSFYDVISFGHGKLFASHSSSAAINPHPRNLTDRQIKTLYGCGGIICACPYPLFVNGKQHASPEEFIAHLRHISLLTDGLGVGLGSDTDGVKTTLTHLKTTSELINFPKYLKYCNFKNYEIQNIFSCNFEHFLEKTAKK